MLRHTWDRASRLAGADRVLTVLTAGQEAFLATEHPPGQVLVQPMNRGTGPGLLLPLLWLANRCPGASVVVFPADHFIWEEARFLAHVTEALAGSRRWPDRLVLLGIEPDGPETSYGWIEPGESCVRSLTDHEMFSVANFWEKPDAELARRLLGRGSLWNSAVMAGTVDGFLGLARVHQPATVESLEAASQRFDTSAAQPVLAAAYRHLPSVDFSRDILAPGRKALLVHPVRDLTWSDWGEPARILRTLEQIGRPPHWFAARP
jgi:mannose-1-phosphate guanylyltransferase